MAEFKNIDIKNIEIFGLSMPKDKCWKVMLDKAGSYAAVNHSEFQKSLKWNVEASYYRLMTVIFNDLDTDTEWTLSFINGKKKWFLEIVGSPEADVTPDQMFDCLHTEDVKKLLSRGYDVLMAAAAACKEKVMQHVEAGDLIEVDEIKLERILSAIDDRQLMKNLKNGVFVR